MRGPARRTAWWGRPRLIAVMLVLALAAAATPGPVLAQAAAADCRFVLGFAALRDRIPTVVGACLDDERFNPANGDSLQHTTHGLLVWRKADNHTAFTDGAHTWVAGPYGLEYRLNTRRFAWEPNPGGLPIVPDAYLGTRSGSPSGPSLRLIDSTLGYVQGPLRFQVAGSGFVPGEAVTLRGTYAPIYSLTTGAPQSPAHAVRCAAVALGPVRAVADAAGRFTVAIQAPENLRTGGEVRIIAVDQQGRASPPLVEVAPEGAPVSAVPLGCRDASGVGIG